MRGIDGTRAPQLLKGADIRRFDVANITRVFAGFQDHDCLLSEPSVQLIWVLLSGRISTRLEVIAHADK